MFIFVRAARLSERRTQIRHNNLLEEGTEHYHYCTATKQYARLREHRGCSGSGCERCYLMSFFLDCQTFKP